MRTTHCHVKIVTPALPGIESETFEWGGPEGAQTLAGLIAVDCGESVDGFVNHFQIHLAPHHFGTPQSWAARIPQYSLVYLDMGAYGRGDDSDTTVMVGLTDAPQETEKWTPTGPQRSISINGRGVECVLEDAEVWWAPYLETHALESSDLDRTLTEPFLEALTGQLAWAREIVGEDTDPRQAVLAVLFYYLLDHASAVMNLLLPGDARIRDLLLPDGYTPAGLDAQLARFPPKPGSTFDTPATWTFVGDALGLTRLLLPTGTLHPQPGPVLNMLLSLIDREFHEFFVRYERDENGGPRRARIIHRIKPFVRPTADNAIDRAISSYDRFNGKRSTASQFHLEEPSLETVEITSADTMGSQLKHGMTAIKNVFFVTPGQGAFFQNDEFKAMLAPLYAGKRSDYAYIGRYGIRPLEHTTPHFVVGNGNTSETDQGAIVEASDTLSKLLRSWYDPHPVMLEGTIEVLGQSRYRAGQRLVWHGIDEDGHPDGRPTREFYVRGVQRRYVFESGAYLTTLLVTRGWTIGDAPAGAHGGGE